MAPAADGSTVRASLRFNSLLRDVGIDPSRVRLVRHRDPECQRDVYKAAVDRDQRFEQYQNAQGSERVVATIRRASHLAAFVVEPGSHATLFVGIWQLLSLRAGNAPDPFRGRTGDSPHGVIIDSKRVPELDELHARLVIDWGGGERAWVQRADRRDKEISEIRRTAASEQPFPGFLKLRCALDGVGELPRLWSERLAETRGIYLLVNRKTGNQYVGSATGDGGFLERWLGYSNGHGGNVALKELRGMAADYDACILETAGSSADSKAILASEDRWKTNLGSRAHGLNRN